jgi:type II secretory pathway component PulJ
MLNKFRFGFTLMETVIVIGLISLLLPVIFSIVFSITRQQAKVYILSQIKREGDNALNIIENLIRNNAVSIHADIPKSGNTVCFDDNLQHPDSGTSNGSDFYFSDRSGEWFKFALSENEIASSSSIPNATIDLTSNLNSRITSYEINCDQTSSFTPPLVSIKFKIEQRQTESLRAEDVASLEYATKIKLRSY